MMHCRMQVQRGMYQGPGPVISGWMAKLPHTLLHEACINDGCDFIARGGLAPHQQPIHHVLQRISQHLSVQCMHASPVTSGKLAVLRLKRAFCLHAHGAICPN